MEYLENKTDTGPLEDGLYRFKWIKDHKGPYTSSEVDLGGHDPNPNHVNESLLSEVDWGAHNPDEDDPEQLTGESIQSFLTFVLSPTHKSLPCPSLWWHHLDLKTNIYRYISIFPRHHLIQVSIIYTHTHTHTHTHTNKQTHTHTHTQIIYISTYYYACQHKNMLHPPQEGSDRILTYGTLLDVLW